MNKTYKTKYIHEGRYVAEIDVELIDKEGGWAPYLPLEEALKLDNVREALRSGDLKSAAKTARLYKMQPIAV